MIGDMPISHMELRELLDRLDDALEGGQPPSEVSRLANMIAVRTGQKVAKQSTAKAITAACRRICRPHEYPNTNSAARASDIDPRKCREWHAKLTAALKAEADAHTRASQQGSASSSGGGGTSSGDAGAASSTSATARCAPDEMAALSGLIEMAQAPDSGQEEAGNAPPPSAPPSPPSPPPPASAATPSRADDHKGLNTPTGIYRMGGVLRGLQREGAIEARDDAAELERELLARDPVELLQWLDESRPDLPTDDATRPRPSAHSTALGRQNLNMIGDMPISHGGASDDDASPEPLMKPKHKPTARGQPQDDSSPGASSSPAQMMLPRRGTPKPRANGIERNDAAADRVTPSPARRQSPRRAAARGGRDATPSPVAALMAARQSPRIVKCERSTESFDDEVQAQPQRRRSASPQPRTAAEARRRAAVDTATRLATHDSAHALYPDDPEHLLGVVISASEARDAGIPNGTATADEWGFQWVRRFGMKTGNLWMRPRAVHDAVDTLCEVWFTIMALVWITQMIKPSARRKQAGYGQGMPTSALLAIYGHRRVMRDCGRHLPDLTETRGVLKGLCARYKQRWGDDAFVPARKQPFSTAHLLAIIAALTSAAGMITRWPAVLCAAVLTAFCYAISTGARKDEWTATFEGDTFVRRANFSWVDDKGADLPSTPANIASRRNGHLLRGRSAPSKCDRLNIEWGGRDMWFRLDDSNPLNFAWRWQQWELEYPCPMGERHRWPAFSPSGDATPFTGKRAEGCLNAVMDAVMTAAEAALRTWHSARITLATRLFARRGAAQGAARGIARDEVEGVIQSLVRWKTPEAMRIYARMEPEQYADYVDMATNAAQACGGIAPADLPETDPTGVLADTEAAVAAIEADAAQKAKAARAAREGVTAAAAGGRKGQRRAAPSTGNVRSGAADPATQQRTFEIDDGQSIAHRGDESWGIMGQSLRMHNSFWGWTDDEYSVCRVVGYAGNFRFASGSTAKHTYIIECDGFYYPATHTCVAGAMVDAGVKRRIKKAPPPRLL